MYHVQGKYAEALVQLQKSLEIDIRVLGCEHQEVAADYNNIGNRMQGDYEPYARRLRKRATTAPKKP